MSDFELCLPEAGGPPTLIPSVALERRLDFRCRFPHVPDRQVVAEAPLLVHLHVHYGETLAPLLASLERCLPGLGPFSLLLSVTSSELASSLEGQLRGSPVVQAAAACELVVTRNLGRNIGPLLVDLWPRLRQADLLLHLHSKRSPQSPHGEEWLESLLAALLPSPEVVGRIRRTFSAQSTLGLLLPQAPDFLRHYLNWGNNFELARLLALWHPGGQRLSRLAPLLFPAGMMLWCRPRALQHLADQLASQDSLPLEPIRVDGTSLHATERLVVHSCEAAGLGWALITAEAPPPGLPAASLSVWNPLPEEFLQLSAEGLAAAEVQRLRLERCFGELEACREALQIADAARLGAEEQIQRALEAARAQEALRAAEAQQAAERIERADAARRMAEAQLAAKQASQGWRWIPRLRRLLKRFGRPA